MNRKLGLSTLVISVLFTSCTVGPKYTRPNVPAAPAYGEQPPVSFQESAEWKAAQPSDGSIRGNWWEIFNEPDLSALEVQVAAANPTVRAAEASFRQARASVRIQRTGLFPTLSVDPAISSNHLSANSPTGALTARGATFANFSLPFDLSYEADLWGRIRRSIAAAREQYQASAADLENVKLALQSELAIYYFEARSLDAQRELLDNNIVAFRRALELTQNRFNGGLASRAEVAQAETQLHQTEAQRIDVDQARAQYNHAIAVLVGKNPEDYQLPLAPLKRVPPVIPTGLPSQLLERRPDIAIAERQLAAANEQIGIAKAAFYPRLVITATGGLQSGSIVNWFTWPSRLWAVGPELSQTVLDFGRRRAQVELTEAAYDEYVNRYRESALTAFREVEDNLAALRILEQEAAKQHDATTSAENSVELAVNRYKGGIVTYLEVITAQTIALTNQRTEVDLMRRRMDASVLLVKALGGGWDTSKLPQS
ncbi:MAG: efflux transporter outer membrane subunit [Bryobacteraceae bacterium]